MHTTLNEIKNKRPCSDGWSKLLASLNKSKADDEPLSFAHILKSNGIKDAVWALRVLPLKDQALFRADVAESVLHIFESKYPNDDRPRKAVEALRLFVRDEISAQDLRKASYSAAESALIADADADAAYSAAYVAYVAYSAADAAYVASYSASAASAATATAAATAAAAADALAKKWHEIEQMFIKYFCGEE